MTPQDLPLSKEFNSNKGSLPWPVLQGDVISRFGLQPHPIDPKVKIDNNGIDIRTNENSQVMTVFEGEVVQAFYLANTQWTIIIRHGEYFTVYSNIVEAYVASGQSVSTKQIIGKSYTDDTKGVAKVHLEIWKGTLKLDPELWLASR